LPGIAANLQTSYEDAEHVLLARHKRLFPTYWQWAEAMLHRSAGLRLHRTRFGWPVHVTTETRYRTLLNHPIQSAGTDVLRLATIGLVESGINVSALVHDAALTECAIEDVDEHVIEVQRIMRLAAKVGIGAEVPVDSTVCRWPDRFRDERGISMFATIMNLLGEIEATGSTAETTRSAEDEGGSQGFGGSEVSSGSTYSNNIVES
jgi:hypothetical protein